MESIPLIPPQYISFTVIAPRAGRPLEIVFTAIWWVLIQDNAFVMWLSHIKKQ